MLRRTWIKLYVDQILRGTCFVELDEAERFVWFGFLLLGGDSPYPGIITATEEIGYSDEQLADLLKTTPALIKNAKRKMVKFNKIEIDDKGKITILNWPKYQSEYQRQRDYRKEYRQELQREVTTGSNEESNKEIEKEIEKENKNNKDRCAFSFNEIWQKYPSKVGKKEAERHFKGSVKSEEDWRNINNALNNYLKSARVKRGYIQNGSTWFNDWQSWIEYTEKDRPKLTPAQEHSKRSIEEFVETHDVR